MKIKIIITVLLLACCIPLLHAQSKDILAKSAMLNADEAYANGQYADCLSYLSDVVANLGKTNSRIQYLKVKSLMAMGNSDQYNKLLWMRADTALKVFFDVTPENTYVPEKYDEMLIAVGKVKKSIQKSKDGKTWQEIEEWSSVISSDPKNAEAYYERAWLKSIRLDDYSGAIKDYNKCIELEPNHYKVYDSRAHAKLMAGDYQGALEDENTQIELHPKMTMPLFDRAYIKELLKDYEGAVKDYNQLIERNPDMREEVLNQRARAKKLMKDYLGAIQDYTESIGLNPNNGNNYYERGRIYLDNLQDVKSSKNDFTKATLIDTDGTMYYAYYFLGEKEKAYSLLNKKIIETANGQSWHRVYLIDLACLYSLDHNQKEALKALTIALEEGFDYKRFSDWDDDHDLDNIKNSAEYKVLISKYRK